MPSNKPESGFAKRVNSREGCWYHSRQDRNPSLTLRNQIKWQDRTLPSVSVPCNSKMPHDKPEFCFVQRVNAAKDVGTAVDNTTIPV